MSEGQMTADAIPQIDGVSEYVTTLVSAIDREQ